jgi:hypothetical protein
MKEHRSPRQVPVSNKMQCQLAAFVEQPSRSSYLAARDAVLAESPLPLTATDFAELDRLLDSEHYQTLLDRLDLLPPAKVLSPRVHFLAAEAAAALGLEADVELERSLFVLTLRGLFATGDGTPANPYVVCQATDEHDVVAALGLEPAGQSLVQHGTRQCDVVICSDGREIWFDVTDLTQIAAQRRGSRRRRKVDFTRKKSLRRRLKLSR